MRKFGLFFQLSRNIKVFALAPNLFLLGHIIEFALGYTHPIFIQLPSEVKVETKSERNQNPIIILESCDKALLGLICAKIRSFRMPEPYKGKGILFQGEVIRRKSGKTAAAK